MVCNRNIENHQLNWLYNHLDSRSVRTSGYITLRTMSLSRFTAVVVYVSGSIAALPLPGRVLLDVV